MLTRAEINKAISDRIKAQFPGVLIQSQDVEEGFKRPSFFVSIETPRTEAFQYNVLREMTCRVRFFPTDRHIFEEEAYDVQDQLEQIFGLNFAAGDRVITINEAETDIVDKVLHYDFHFSYFEDSGVEETGAKMQELGYNE